MAYTEKYKSKRKMKKECSCHKEDVGNFYTARPRMGRDDEQMFRSRRGDYGKKRHPEGGLHPIPLTGTFEF